MPLILEASSLSLNDVHRLLKLQKQPNGLFADFLSLEPLTEFEQQDLARIANDFERYLYAGKVSEGLVKFLTLAPLMRLAGFYDVPIRLTIDISEKYQCLSMTGFQLAIANCKYQPLSTLKSRFETVSVDNKVKISIYTYQFLRRKITPFYIYKTNAPIRNLTSPHIVIIIFSYLVGFNLNLSDATLNIFNIRIKCSTNILSEAISLFPLFCERLNSPFFGFFVGVLIDLSPI